MNNTSTVKRPRVLAETVAALDAEQRSLDIQFKTLDRSELDAPWAEQIANLLREVRAFLESRTIDRDQIHQVWGWALEAKRKFVFSMTEAQLEAEALALREEADQKLKSWRRESALRLTTLVLEAQSHSARELPRADRAAILERALRIRDEHTQNSYRDASAVRSRMIRLAAITTGAILAIGLVSLWSDFTDEMVDSRSAPLFVLAFGFLGGCISAFRPLVVGGRRFPEELAQWYVTLVRPLTGAAAALALYPFLTAGLLPLELESLATLAAISVAAGFSERPLSRAVSGLGGFQ